MKTVALTVALLTGMFGLLFLTGCVSDGKIGSTVLAAPAAKTADGCQLCYDKPIIVRNTSAKGAQWNQSQLVQKHQCPDCKTTLSSGKTMKCGGCAPEGGTCGKCKA